MRDKYLQIETYIGLAICEISNVLPRRIDEIRKCNTVKHGLQTG